MKSNPLRRKLEKQRRIERDGGSAGRENSAAKLVEYDGNERLNSVSQSLHDRN